MKILSPLLFAVLTVTPSVNLSQAAPQRCLFEMNGGLATGRELRARGVHTLRIHDLKSVQKFQDLSSELQQIVKEVIARDRVSMKEFLNNEAMLEQYAAGHGTDANAGIYVIITHAPRGNLHGRIYRRLSGKYISVVDIRRGAVEQCSVRY